MRMKIHQVYKVKQPSDRDGGSRKESNMCSAVKPQILSRSINSGKEFRSSALKSSSTEDPLPDLLAKMDFNLPAESKPQKCLCMAIKVMAFAVTIPSTRAMLRQYWRPSLVADVEATTEENVFRITMKFPEDKLNILKKRVWVMANVLVLMEKWKRFLDYKDHCFRFAEFRVQLLNLHRQLLRDEVIRDVLRKVGEVSKVSLFLGVPIAQIKMDLRMPFWPVVPVIVSGFPIWVSLAFEDLKNVCFTCGILGH